MAITAHPYKGDPRFTESGRVGARRRWGRERHLRLDTLSEPIRSAVEALIAAEQNAQERERGTRKAADVPTSTAQEAKRASATTPTL